jgi:hypothetical protein
MNEEEEKNINEELRRAFEEGKVRGRMEVLEDLIKSNTNIKIRPEIKFEDESF